MTRTALPFADRSALADRYQQRGQKALQKPSSLFGKSPLKRARENFDKAVWCEPDRALSIGDHLQRKGELKEAIRYKQMQFARLSSISPMRAPLATQIVDLFLQRSHESHLAYSGRKNRWAQRYYTQAISTDASYYPAHVGRYSTYIDGYHHSCRTHFWRRHAKGDVYLYERALIEWSTVLTLAPQATCKEWLREPGDLFELPGTPRTTVMYRNYVVPALGGVLVPSGTRRLVPDEELTRLALICARRLIDAESWLTADLLPYLLQATDTGGLTAATLPDLLRIYDKIAHAPLPEGPALIQASARLRQRFHDDTGALELLVDFQKVLLDAYSQQPFLTQMSLCELSKLARDNVPVAYDALDLMLATAISHPATAPVAIQLTAKRAAAIADHNIADSDALVFHVIDDLRRLANYPTPGLSMAVANALQGPLRKYYDQYRAAEEDARRQAAAKPKPGLPSGDAKRASQAAGATQGEKPSDPAPAIPATPVDPEKPSTPPPSPPGQQDDDEDCGIGNAQKRGPALRGWEQTPPEEWDENTIGLALSEPLPKKKPRPAAPSALKPTEQQPKIVLGPPKRVRFAPRPPL